MDLTTWAELIYLDPTINIRSNPSLHQEYIVDVIGLVKEARDNPSDEVKEKLLSVNYIRCDGNSEFVRYARYLQHAINVLKSEGLEDAKR